MAYEIKTMDDFDFRGKTVLVRLDLNSPIDENREIADDRRFLSHVPTLKELIENNAKIVVIAHQSRPGKEDFTTMVRHAKKLSGILKEKANYNLEVRYEETLFGTYARETIKNMNNKEILMLENVRFDSEEIYNYPEEAKGECPYAKKADTHLVRKLSRVIDIYINDAFGTAHRCQPSVVGFPQKLPSCAGRLMEKELKILNEVIKKPEKPVTFVLGGAKADDSIEVAKRALENGADRILVGGLVGNIFLASRFWIGDASIKIIKENKMTDQIDIAGELFKRHRDRIVMPLDVAVKSCGKRVVIDVEKLTVDEPKTKDCPIFDIGEKTVAEYKNIIKNSKTVLANAVMGLVEKENFAYGTNEILTAIADSDAFSVLGGGSTVAVARKLGLEGKVDWMSTGGGASMEVLAGKKLPAIEALKIGG